MTSAVLFDTLAYANRLKEAGVPERQAEAQIDILAEIVGNNLATKKDLKLLKQDLKHDLELKMAEHKNELIKWVFGVSITQATIIIACIKLLH